MADYKKAWNKLKRNLIQKDDYFKLKGRMYMTSQQIENNTATIDLGWCEDDRAMAECHEKGVEIINTDAFQNFAREIFLKDISFEVKENAYYSKHLYMRIHY